MRCHLMRRVLSGAAFGLFGMLGQVQAATTLDFESLTPALFVDGESFAQSVYTLTQSADFGVVGADFLIAQAPIGNATQFYSGLNDSSLALTRGDGVGFELQAFDAGFVAPVPLPAGVVAGRIVLLGLTRTGSTVLNTWEFTPSDADGNFAFKHFSTGLSSFTNLASVKFLACVYDDDGNCGNPAQNLAQFSLDNIVAVPEPSTYALLALGLAGIGAGSRRRARG